MACYEKINKNGDVMNIFLDYIDKGGIIFFILVVVSVFALTIIIYKFFEIFFFCKFNIKKKNLELDSSSSIDEFKNKIQEKKPSNKINLILNIIEIFQENKSEDKRKEELNLLMQKELNKIEIFLPTLEIISQVSTLVGLLGTVIGMIDSFNELELGGSLVDPSILAGGIWTALLTTAMGLIVAIPALISHYFFEKKITNHQKEMDSFLIRLSKISSNQ